MQVTKLLPHLVGLHVLNVTTAEDILTIEARRRSTMFRCPSCRRRSRSVHSTYVRQIADQPIGGRRVLIRLRVRRFRCRERACPRRTFAEQVPRLAARYARCSAPLYACLEDIGLSLGGRPGARFARRRTMCTSRTTLLRLVRRLPLPDAGSPSVLGVDDFALRRGHRYGTVLVDLQAHRVVDLLPERTSEGVTGWMAQRAAPDIVCRDRGGAYAEAARQVAPGATQIADRFHLSCNGSAVLERVLARHPAAVRAVTVADVPGPTLPKPESGAAVSGLDPRRERRRTRYEEVVALHRAGRSITAISAQVGVCRQTVRKYVSADAFPDIAPRRTLLRAGSADATYLHERWGEGCRDAQVLHAELRARGFSGSLRMVQRAVAGWREEPGQRGRRAAAPRSGTPCAPPRRRALSARQATWLLLRPSTQLTAEERVLRERLLTAAPAIQAALSAVENFRALVRQRERAALDPWLAAAESSGVPEIRGFAAGIRQDYAAVAAALESAWSSGQVEGHVTRIKLCKRAMYGRGKLDLLRRRVLLAS